MKPESNEELEDAITRHCQNYKLMVENARNPELRDTYAGFASKSHDYLLDLIQALIDAKEREARRVGAVESLEHFKTVITAGAARNVNVEYWNAQLAYIDKKLAVLAEPKEEAT